MPVELEPVLYPVHTDSLLCTTCVLVYTHFRTGTRVPRVFIKKIKEQAAMAYDRFVVDKSTEAVSFTLNYPNGLPTSSTNKDGNDDTDPPTTIKQDPEAELILHKAKKKFMSKANPKQNFKFPRKL